VDYLFVLGLQDVKLRASIKRAALQESSKFLGVLGSAQMEKQIEEPVIKISKDFCFYPRDRG
jgi:hypothetical protein